MGELLRVGTWLDDEWRIDARLARGGVATVYAATHRDGRAAAVKVLHAELSNHGEVKRRFAQEGYLANQVEHSRVVRVIADGTVDGQPYLVMDLLVGEHLDERRNRLGGRLSAAEVVHLGIEILKVLEAAHAKGIVHRDIKPDNVYLTTDGRVMVLDFGIARMRQTLRSEETATGLLLGTAEFMSPEQALGRSREIDEKVDIWGVGATMFMLLAGEAVHPGETIGDILRATAATPARPLGFVAQDVPPFLSAVVDRALAFDKNARWPTARAMREALERCAKNLDSRAPSGVFAPVVPQPSLPDLDDDSLEEDAAERTISTDDQPTMTPMQSPVSAELQGETPEGTAPAADDDPSTVSVMVPQVASRVDADADVDSLLDDSAEVQTEVRRPTAEEAFVMDATHLAPPIRRIVGDAEEDEQDQTAVRGIPTDDAGEETAVAQVPSRIAGSDPPEPSDEVEIGDEQDEIDTVTGLPPSRPAPLPSLPRREPPPPSFRAEPGRIDSHTMPMPRQSLAALRAAAPASQGSFPASQGSFPASQGSFPASQAPFPMQPVAPVSFGPPTSARGASLAPPVRPSALPPWWVIVLLLLLFAAGAAALGAALADHVLGDDARIDTLRTTTRS
ncbi:MAG: protein kinase [Polyangiaceae bacterium]|nr:protein kinase [Polyangiaceae bacterium]